MKNKRGRPVKNIIGHKYNRFTVVELDSIQPGVGSIWVCKCDCGNIKKINAGDLKSGNTKSCGCHLSEVVGKQSVKHGATKNSNVNGTYKSWRSMKARCSNPKCKSYYCYGGRGITFCDRWDEYKNFVDDMGERPIGYSLERKDPNGNYEPKNCCWIPNNQQSKNTRRTAWVLLNGEKMIQADAARRLNKNPSTIYEWKKYPKRIPIGIDIIFLQNNA